MAKRSELLVNDARRLALPVILIAVYCIITQLAFHRVCPFSLITGIPCPGCGLTRAAYCIMNGRFFEAVSYNATIIAWIFLGFYCVFFRYGMLRKPPVLYPIVCALSLLTIAYYVTRILYSPTSDHVMKYSEVNLFSFIQNSSGRK